MSEQKQVAYEVMQHERLLLAVMEHVREPLVRVRNQAELVLSNDGKLNPGMIVDQTSVSLQLVEHFMTWQRFAIRGESIELRQAGLSAVLHDVAAALRSITARSQLSINLDISSKAGPIVTDAEVLSAGLSSLGLACIEAGAGQDESITIGLRKNRWGIVAGVYSQGLDTVSTKSFRQALDVTTSGRQAMPSASHASMSGVVVADALFRQLGAQVRPAKHKHMNGFAITLTPSPQLALL